MVWLVGFIAGAFHVAAERSLWLGGRVTDVRVESRIQTTGRNASRMVEYTLSVPGYRAQERENVDSGWFWAADVGESAPVTYLPDRPQVHEYGRVDADAVRRAVRQAFAMTLAASVIPFVIFVGVESQARRESRLLRFGWLVDATIVRNEPAARPGQDHVEYEFTLSDGTRRHGASRRGGGGRLAEGAVLPVLYPPDGSFESTPVDELKWVELA